MKSVSKEDYIFYSLLTVSILTVFVVLLYHFWLSSFVSLPVCTFYEYLGVYCPGCGGTRAVLALLSGNVLLSIYFHPVVLYTITIVGIYLLLQIIDRLRKKKHYTLPFSVGFVYAGIGLLFCNWIFRLVLLFCFHISM